MEANIRFCDFCIIVSNSVSAMLHNLKLNCQVIFRKAFAYAQIGVVVYKITTRDLHRSRQSDKEKSVSKTDRGF